eukprot:jgi/Mesen1/4397/ME000223S03459
MTCPSSWQGAAAAGVEETPRRAATMGDRGGAGGVPPASNRTPAVEGVAEVGECRAAWMSGSRLAFGSSLSHSISIVVAAGGGPGDSSADFSLSFGGTADGHVLVWDALSGRTLAEINHLAGKPVACVAAHSSPSLTAMAAANADGKVFLYKQ